MSAASTGATNSSSTSSQDQQTNGTLDTNALVGNDAKRDRLPGSSDENNDVDGNTLGVGGGNISSSNNDLNNDQEDVKESAIKRMRTSNVTGNGLTHLGGGGAVSNNAAVIAQNNSAYAAAAQSYHNALAAINYTGISLQANKNPQPPNPSNYPGANALQQSPGGSHGLAAHQHQHQQQHQQQQQFLSQYQAMLAALASNPGALQGQFNAQAAANAAAVGQQQHQQQQAAHQHNLQQSLQSQGQHINPAFAAVAAINPLLAASFPQLAAQQRANMMAGQQGSAAAALQSAQLNQLAAAGIPTNNLQFNHLMGMQFAGQGGGGLPLQQNQQALLAAYGQIGRGPMPVVTGAQTMATQQLFVGNPAAAAAAAQLAASNGALQTGVKRMRPT